VAISGGFDQATINQVQQANDIVDVIGEHVSLKRKGREMVGLCPFHDDHRPSLNVNTVKQIFKCFACGAGGGIFTFVQMRENLTFPQAIQRLADRAGIKLQPASPAQGSAQQTPEVDPNALAKVNAWAVKYFQQNLYDEKKGKYARDYIAQRQITGESAQKWRLGLAVDGGVDLVAAAKGRNIPGKLLQQAGLVTALNQDKFVNRLMFPITDVTGRVIGFGGRALDGAEAKYINSPATALFDKSNCLYGLEQARHQIGSTGAAIVVEGYTDCIMAHQFGCRDVVAALGTSFTDGHGRTLRRYAKKVVLIFDSDVAGVEAANRALEVCLSQRIDIKLATVPQGKDPCDFLLAAGKEGFDKLVAAAVDVFQFKWNRLLETFDSDETLAGRKMAIEEFLQTIATSLWAGYTPVLDRGLILNRLTKIVGLDSKELNTELCKRIGRLAKAERNRQEKPQVRAVDYGQGLFAVAQREVLEVLLNEPRLFELVRQKTTAEAFDVPVLRQTAKILFETLDADMHAPLSVILAKAESVELGQCIAELAQAGEQKNNFELRLAGALDVLQRCQAEKEKDRVKAGDDQTRFLQCVRERAERQNRHNVGMV
jgi:DNA primase